MYDVHDKTPKSAYQIESDSFATELDVGGYQNIEDDQNAP
jgi:hypothetical protein